MLNVAFDLGSYLALLQPEGQFCFVAAPTQTLSLRAGLLYDYGRRRMYGSYVGSRSDVVELLEFASMHDVVPNVELMDIRASRLHATSNVFEVAAQGAAARRRHARVPGPDRSER